MEISTHRFISFRYILRVTYRPLINAYLINRISSDQLSSFKTRLKILQEIANELKEKKKPKKDPNESLEPLQSKSNDRQ